MSGRKLIWRLAAGYALITVLAVAAVTAYAAWSFRAFHLEQKAGDLETMGRLLQGVIGPLAAAGDDEEVNRLCRELGSRSGTRLTVVQKEGRVMGDSERDPASMQNHWNRPEIKTALTGGVGREVRFSATLQRSQLYVALPLESGGIVVGALRLSVPEVSLDEAVAAARNRAVAGALVVSLAGVLVILLTSRMMTAPLARLRRGAERFAAGELGLRLPEEPAGEMGELARAMNLMAAELKERIETVESQRETLEAVLSSMAEGVLAVDAKQRVILLNRSAELLVGAPPGEEAEGRTLQEMVRNPDLQRFVVGALESEVPVEGEMTVWSPGKRQLRARGTVLRGAGGERLGALVVLDDVSRMRRLEQIRRDFVANASHEIRTPVTAIKGFVETLMDGAISNPAHAARFLEIIHKQSQRLGSLVEDLLSLASLEQGGGREGGLQEEAVCSILKDALEACREEALRKRIRVGLECDETLRARVDPALLSQAIVNLVRNAVAYSGEDGEVRVTGRAEKGMVRIRVSDRGIGIAAEHLPRIFERFYRVDKGRSRESGGTGLGLAIVKHIVQMHGGTVTVESSPGAGSTFTVSLPALGAEEGA